ncbi:MAG: DUF3473 domain-containing protein [Bacteroidales bacterium]|nr:DUF3473 domain-containing protein [Bacteroidales bacterium]
MNILSFDIEEWYIEKKFNGARKEKYDEYDKYLYRILDTLDERGVKGTFFCVGRLATDFPYVVKAIAKRGHEIGCHSNEHLWLTKMDERFLEQETKDAIAALEDVSGKKVKSYRAPAFSIGEKNKWAIEVLAKCGIERDASIFPAKRDFGGFDSFPADSPVIVDYQGAQIKEFPICLAKVAGREMCFSGGGYFRFFPYWYIKKELQNRNYGICYFHIGDLIHNTDGMMSKEEFERYFKEKGTLANRFKRYLKSSIGTNGAFDKMSRLIENIEFMNIEQADIAIDWNKVETVRI